MKSIFEQGEFSLYRKESLNESCGPIVEFNNRIFAEQKTTVFISHKHDELDDLKDIIGFLEQNYNVKVYIDSRDSSMPKITSGETAARIKERIKQCDKFILLATNAAIEAKWCNWELGYGDSQKFKNHIALFSMKPKEKLDSSYKGNEYMQIYPYITYSNGNDRYADGKFIKQGYYVYTKHQNGNDTIISLSDWFLRKD